VPAGGWIWPAFATCTWPFSAGQGCAKVSDYRFIDSKLTNYVPNVPIAIARAGYEVYAHIIICQNSIALRAQSCEAALQCVDSAAERALGCQLGVCRAGSSSFSSSRRRLWPWSSAAAAARGTKKAGEEEEEKAVSCSMQFRGQRLARIRARLQQNQGHVPQYYHRRQHLCLQMRQRRRRPHPCRHPRGEGQERNGSGFLLGPGI